MTPQAQASREEHLAILVPTRGRPEALRSLFESIEGQITRPDLVTLWIYGDEGDTATQTFVAAWQAEARPLQVKALFEKDVPTQGARYNRLRENMSPKADIYLIGSDKMHIRTPGWDEVVRRSYRAIPDRLQMCFLRDNINKGNFGAFPIVSEAWAQCTGRLTTGYFPFWYDDTWLNDVGHRLGRWRVLPIEMDMAQGSTQRMVHLRFWERFYWACADERDAEARALARLIHQHDPVALELALALSANDPQREGPPDWPLRDSDLESLEHTSSARLKGPQPVPPPEDPYWEVESQACALLFAKREAAQQAGDHAAVARLESALLHSGPAAESQVDAIRDALAANQLTLAQQLLTEHHKAFPFHPEALLLWAEHLLATGHPGSAIEVLQGAKMRFPGMVEWDHLEEKAKAKQPTG